MPYDLERIWDYSHLLYSSEHDYYFDIDIPKHVYDAYGKIFALFHGIVAELRHRKNQK